MTYRGLVFAGSVHVQSSSVADLRQAVVAHTKRWQVRKHASALWCDCSSFSYICSGVYVKRILSKLPAPQLHLAAPIQSVRTSEHHGAELNTASGETSVYDHIIFACHSDTALNILRAGGTLTHQEQTILGAFEWNTNVAVLHNDSAVSIPS